MQCFSPKFVCGLLAALLALQAVSAGFEVGTRHENGPAGVCSLEADHIQLVLYGLPKEQTRPSAASPKVLPDTVGKSRPCELPSFGRLCLLRQTGTRAAVVEETSLIALGCMLTV